MSGTEKHQKKNKFFKNTVSVMQLVENSMNIIVIVSPISAFIFRNKYIMLGILIISCIIFGGCLVYMMCIWKDKNKNIDKSNDKKVTKQKTNGKNSEREHKDKNINFEKDPKKLAIVMVACIVAIVISFNKFMKSAERVVNDTPDAPSQGPDINTSEHGDGPDIPYEEVSDISFCLNEAVIPNLEKQDAVKVFYVFYQNETNVVINHVDELGSSEKLSDIEEWTEKEKEKIASASVAESNFKKDVEKAKAYKEKREMNEWKDTVPNVSDYKTDVANVRLGFIENGKADEEICFLTANDFQYIGDEYKNQNKEYKAVIYYWSHSILYTEEALSFKNLSVENRDKYYGYLKARYKDIADYIEQIWEQIEEGDKVVYGNWRYAAQRIYEEMP